jgi:hypothetical protein
MTLLELYTMVNYCISLKKAKREVNNNQTYLWQRQISTLRSPPRRNPAKISKMGCGASHSAPTEQVDKPTATSHVGIIFQDHHAVLVVATSEVPKGQSREDHSRNTVTQFDEQYHRGNATTCSRKISQSSATDGCYNLSSSANPHLLQDGPADERVCPIGSSIPITLRSESVECDNAVATTTNTLDDTKHANNDTKHPTQSSTSRGASHTNEGAGSPTTKLKPRQNLRERLKKSGGADFQSIIAPDLLIAFPPQSHASLHRASSDDEDFGVHHSGAFFHAMDTIPPLRSSGVAGISTSLNGSHTAAFPPAHLNGSPTPSRRESSLCAEYFSSHRGSTSSAAAPSSPLREGRTRTIQFVGETQCLLRSGISDASVGDIGDAAHTCPTGILAAETSFGEEMASTHVSSSTGSASSLEVYAKATAPYAVRNSST